MKRFSAWLVVLLAATMALALIGCGGGGGETGPAPTKAPKVAGEVQRTGTSALRGVSQGSDDLYVRVVVTNPNAGGTDVKTIRFCIKHDPNEDSPLTETEARGYLNPVPSSLPNNVDVQEVAYESSPQIIRIDKFKGGALSPNDRYWLSAVFVASDGTAGPVTPPQRFKLIYKYQLVQPPNIGILKDFQGKVRDHCGDPLPNAFVQYFHEGVFMEATVTEDNGTYYMEVLVPNPTSASSLKEVSCEESDTPTDYIMKVYHPYYNEECLKYLLPEYVHYYVDFKFKAEWYNHNEGAGCSL